MDLITIASAHLGQGEDPPRRLIDWRSSERLPAKEWIDVFKEFRRRIQPSDAGRALTLRQMGRLMAFSGPRTSLWVEFLYYSALRVQTACNIRLVDVTENGDCIEIRYRNKGGERRQVLITPALYRRIRERFTGRRFLFETRTRRPYTRHQVYELLTDASKRVLGYTVSPHDLRRSFATIMDTMRPELAAGTIRHGGWTNYDEFRKRYVRVRLKPQQIPRIPGKQQGYKNNDKEDKRMKCEVCEQETGKLYQGGQCKTCVLESMERLRPLINHYRDPSFFKRYRPGNETLQLVV